MSAPTKKKRRWYRLGLKKHPAHKKSCRHKGCKAKGTVRFHHFWFCRPHKPKGMPK